MRIHMIECPTAKTLDICNDRKIVDLFMQYYDNNRTWLSNTTLVSSRADPAHKVRWGRFQ